MIKDHNLQVCNRIPANVTLDFMIIMFHFVQVWIDISSLVCDPSCPTCSGATSSLCTSCVSDNKRELSGVSPNACSCKDGFYDDSKPNCTSNKND